MHARHEEDLVVHREPEDDREQHHRQERLDRAGPVHADDARQPSPLEDCDHDPERRADAQHVHQHRLERNEHRPEHRHEQEGGHENDHPDEQRQLVRERVAKVVEHRGRAADVNLRSGCPPHLRHGCGAQAADQRLGRRALRRSRGVCREHRDVAARAELGRRYTCDAALGGQGVAQPDRGRPVTRARERGHDLERPVEPGPETLREEVVGLARGRARGVRSGIAGTQPQRQRGDAQREQKRGCAERQRPRTALDETRPARPPRPPARRALAQREAPAVDPPPDHAQQGGQERERGDHGEQDGQGGGDRRAAQEGDAEQQHAQ